MWIKNIIQINLNAIYGELFMLNTEFNELINQIKVDNNAFRKIYQYYCPLITDYVNCNYHLISGDEIAEEFFIMLINRNDFVICVENPTEWVYECCRNLCKSKNRQFINDEFTV